MLGRSGHENASALSHGRGEPLWWRDQRDSAGEGAMLEYDPFDYKFHDNPYPVYRSLRDHAPVYHNAKYNFWALSRYHDCQQAVRDFKTFSSAQGTSLEELKAQLPTLINSDPPVHTRLRHLVSGLFTPEKLAPLE